MPERFNPTSFEWDENKATSNEAKHGVSSADAIAIFLDPDRLQEADRRIEYGEERHNAIGCVDGRIYAVTFTLRDGRARIISARKAHWKERRRYDDGA